MDKTKLVYGAIRFVTSLAVGTVVGNAIKATTPIGIGPVNRVLVGIGEFVLGAVVGDLTADYLMKQIEPPIKPEPSKEESTEEEE